MLKKELGQFYTKNASYILQDLIDFIPKGYTIIDPFCGEWDLLNLVKNNFNVEGYDLEPKNKETVKRDTLQEPLNYRDSWIITNPPYLARNKNKDKTLYNLYKLDDLYKISLKSLIGCEGGIVIVPLNFFSSQDNSIRTEFLSQYKILKVYVFEEQVFDDTTYTVCAFAFVKEQLKEQKIPFIIKPNNNSIIITLSEENDYMIGKEIYDLPVSSIKIKRILKGDEIKQKTIFLMGVDTRKEKINFSIQPPYYGKITDRCFASFIIDTKYNLEDIVIEANKNLNIYREKYLSLFLTNYRDFGRKRLGFDLACTFIKNAVYNLGGT